MAHHVDPSSLPSCFSAGVPAREIVLRHMYWYSQSLMWPPSSACHVLIDGVSVGKHPLVARLHSGELSG